MTHALARGAVGMALLAVAGCTFGPSSTPEPAPSSISSPSATEGTPSASSSPSRTAVATATASATPEPTLGLDLPSETDPRVVSVTVTPEVAEDGGRILVSVTSLADSRIDELVLRWPEGVGETLILAPFAPSDARIVDGGSPLVQPWTKWVLGPGEQGEPAGTISLGWGPLFPGATLDIPILVTRAGPGPVAFDLQVLAGSALLTGEDGTGLELRVEVD